MVRKTYKLLPVEMWWLIGSVVLFIVLRSINFMDYLTFIGWDQAEHAILALEMVRNKSLTLIGPRVSAVLYAGRQIFLGPAMTYIMAFFLALGGWEPAVASYLFMVASGLMIFPLYYGVKWLTNRRAAWLMVIVYTLLPYYLTYTRFLWNPNFQFALLPILFWLMGYYHRTKKNWVLLAVGLWLGVLFQLHYQFVISIALIAVYYFVWRREGWQKLFVFTAGFVAGVSPLILFELRHQFYLTQTLILFAKHRNELEMYGSRNHYLLSQSFVLLLGVVAILAKYLDKLKTKTMAIVFGLLGLTLFILSARITFVPTDTCFWAPVPHWNYAIEQKIYDIVRKEGLTDYNVTNQMYDPVAMLQKYMMKRDGIVINYTDYWKNKYLFVVDRKGKKNYMDNPGYEVLFLRPYRVLKNWQLNDYYVMHLIERLPKEQ